MGFIREGYNHSYQSLVDVINRNNRHEIILAKTNRSMWEILSNCNVAILAGGLMLVESIYAGLPSINIFEKEWHEKQLVVLSSIKSCNICWPY